MYMMNKKLILVVIPFTLMFSGCRFFQNLFGSRDSGLRPDAQERLEDGDLAGAVNTQVSSPTDPERCGEQAETRTAEAFETRPTNTLIRLRANENCSLGLDEYSSLVAINRYLNPSAEDRYGMLSVGDQDIHHNLLDVDGNSRVERINQSKTLIDTKYNEGLFELISQVVSDDEVQNCGVFHMTEGGEQSASLLSYLGLDGVTAEQINDPEWEMPELLPERLNNLLNTRDRLAAATALNSSSRQEMYLASDVNSNGEHTLTYRCAINQPIRMSQMIAPRDRSALIFNDDVIDLMPFTPATTTPSTISTRSPASAEPIDICTD